MLNRQAALGRLLLVIAFLVVWEIAARTIADPQFVSQPTQVLPRLVGQLGDSTVLSAFGYTSRAIALAFVLGSAVGITIGIVIGLSHVMQDAFMAPLLFMLSIPKVIFLPIFVLLFGIGLSSAVAFATFEACTYVAVVVSDGTGLIQERHLKVAKAFKASMVQKLVTVILPSSLPGIFTGLWFAMKHAFVGILTAELWASSGGVGALTRSYTENRETTNILALVIAVSAFAILLGSMWNNVESRLTKWK